MDLLSLHLPAPIAATMVKRALDRARTSELNGACLPAVLEAVEVGVRLFAEPDQRDEVLLRLRLLREKLLGYEQLEELLHIRSANDARYAQHRARELANSLQARAIVVQKAVLITGVLADNLVVHAAGGGRLFLTGRRRAPAMLGLVASDAGPGIADLEAVLKSPSRSGFGLSKIKASVDHFHVVSRRSGTRVEVQIAL